MKITNVRLIRLEGPLRSGLADYLDTRWSTVKKPSPYQDVFCEIETDEGLTGLSFGGSPEIWPVVKAIGGEIIGEDPQRIEYIWDRLYSQGYHRYRRLPAIAVLWDLIGKAKGESVYRLLGGPTRERIRAYAAMQFFPTDPESAARHSVEMVEQGFTAIKWYIPYGAQHGKEGLNKNVALIRAVREAVGDDVDIMIDGLFTNPPESDMLYALELAHRQYFYMDYYEPVDGYFYPPIEPGLGWELDPAKQLMRIEL